ncbi:MAG: hypothetical protein KA795_18330 [Burkholderiaceae bacterium]|nr:hypothetical protein [Burkholderiaceae bacterium]
MGRLPVSKRGSETVSAEDYAAISAKKNALRWIKQLRAIGKWPATSTPAARPAV